MKQTTDRTTKYVTAVRESLHTMGHATNSELLHTLRNTYPEVSATTIHRITTRLLTRKEIRLAPSSNENSMRFDSNTQPHDHFMCNICGTLHDAQLGKLLRKHIETAIDENCSISGDLVVTGICKKCARHKPKTNQDSEK